MPTFPKYITWLLIAIIIIGIALLYFSITNKKDTNSQNDLLLAMAQKLGAGEVPSPKPQVPNSKEQPEEKSAEDEDEIIRISDKLCFGKQLTKEEKDFQKKWDADVKKELANSQGILKTVIDKFLSGATEFEEYEQDFYENNKEEIDTIIHNQKLFAGIIDKLVKGETDFTEEQLQFQQNYPKEIEKELKRIRMAETPSTINHQPSTITHHPSPINPPLFPKPNHDFGKANPPLAKEERLKLILSFFTDGIPKTISELSPMYAKATGTKGSAGSLYNLFGRLEEGTLQTQKMIIDERAKVYYGLPEWFDGKKLKKEYKSKIAI